MKSPILGPYFESSQRADCTGVCRPFRGSQAMILGLHPGKRMSGGFHPGRQEVSAVVAGGLCRGVRWKPD
ncbi:unnamed protein product [Staurois parvus]|uniref:Uncharacterized protein n=1 Tax=Staurois parvus TaxID=386267 RepID=A0ABN9FMP0_9NEOB|nr:unnamed protein product [Staurois parvus]